MRFITVRIGRIVACSTGTQQVFKFTVISVELESQFVDLIKRESES